MIEGKTIVALCTSGINDNATETLIDSLSHGLNRIDAKLFVYCTCRDVYRCGINEAGEERVYELIDYERIDVLVLWSERIRNKDLLGRIVSKAGERNISVITIDEPIDGCINIYFEQASGIANITRHLIEEHNIRDFHFIAGIRGNSWSNTRLTAFKQVLDEYGIPFTNSMVSFGDFWEKPTALVVQKLIDEKRVPKAFVCANDTMAIATIETLAKNGIRVPDDVAVTGFDGIDDIHYYQPTVSSCEYRYEDVSETICYILSDVIEGFVANRNFSLPLQAMYGRSCGCEDEHAVNPSLYVKYFRTRYYHFRYYEQHLSDFSAKASQAGNLSELSQCFDDEMISDVCCFLTKKSTDETFPPENAAEGPAFEREMTLLFDSDSVHRTDDSFVPRTFDAGNNVVPNLSDKLGDEYPLIFYALNDVDCPLGYACFHFNRHDYRNYFRMPLIVGELSHAVSDYHRRKYCRYLENK